MTHLDERGLEAAFKAAPDDWNCRKSHLQVIETAIRAYLSALPSSPVSELVEALMEWSKPDTGSHDAGVQLVCSEAATTLTSLSTRNAELEAENARLRAELEYQKKVSADRWETTERQAYAFDDMRIRAEAAEARLAEAMGALEKSENLFEAISHHIDEHSFSFAKGFCSQGAFTARRVREGGKVE